MSTASNDDDIAPALSQQRAELEQLKSESSQLETAITKQKDRLASLAGEMQQAESRLKDAQAALVATQDDTQLWKDSLTDDQRKLIAPGSETLLDKEKDRWLKLAQLYDQSWTSLRDHEWRLEITYWAAVITITAALSGTGAKILGVEVGNYLVDAVSPTFLFTAYIVLWLLMVIGKVGYQMAFQYFARNRDYYINKCGSPGSPLYRWSPVYSNDNLPRFSFKALSQLSKEWHNQNAVVVVVATAFITGLLLSVSYSMIASTIKKTKQDVRETIYGSVRAIVNQSGHEGTLKLNDGTDVHLLLEETDVVSQTFGANDPITVVGVMRGATSIDARRISNTKTKQSVTMRWITEDSPASNPSSTQPSKAP